MRPIRILPDSLADQIAAGEVVERPASVVKELVENAIDAGARSIAVEIEGGGIGSVRVSDDGHGMGADDAALAVRRHATSKIASREDLERIATLGFRGEALPSIASVSRFTLITRTRESVAGTEVRIDGGESATVRETGCAPGTTVIVRELFFNVPARRKFLKSAGTESSHVRETLVRAGLADPGLKITLSRDGRSALSMLPTSDVAQRAALLFPAERLSRIEGSRDGIETLALLSAPERARSGAGQLHLYVNGRPVRDRALARSIAFAFGSVLPAGRYPAGVVYVRLPAERVDVNVHPQKAEVRFDDARAVLDAITRMLASGLGTQPFRGPAARGADFWTQRLAASSGGGSDPWDLSGANAGGGSSAEPGSGSLPRSEVELPPGVAAVSGAAASASERGGGTAAGAEIGWRSPESGAPSAAGTEGVDGRGAGDGGCGGAVSGGEVSRVAELGPIGTFASMRVLGQTQRTYLVCESDRAIVVLDQHAADERVRFDRLRAQFEARAIATQRLLIPERVEVAASEAALIDERAAAITSLGLEVSRIGETSVAIHAVPAILRRARPERLLRDVLAQLTYAGERAFGDAIDTALATMACHGAIRAGDSLAPREIEELLRALDRVKDFARHCPHGRPIAFELPFTELARRVGR